MLQADIKTENDLLEFLLGLINKTFVDLYVGKNVTVVVDKVIETAYFNPSNLEIHIGIRMFKDFIAEHSTDWQTYDLKKLAKSVLFHEISHGIWTPTFSEDTLRVFYNNDWKIAKEFVSPTDSMNLFEDSRIEYCCKTMLQLDDVDFDYLLRALYNLKPGEFKEVNSFRNYCFNLLRLGVVMFPEDYNLITEAKNIIREYKDVNNIHQEFLTDKFGKGWIDSRKKYYETGYSSWYAECKSARRRRAYAEAVGKWYAQAYQTWLDNKIKIVITDEIIRKNMQVALDYDVKKNTEGLDDTRIELIRFIQNNQNNPKTFKQIKIKLATMLVNKYKNIYLDENKKKMEELANEQVR